MIKKHWVYVAIALAVLYFVYRHMANGAVAGESSVQKTAVRAQEIAGEISHWQV
jgi:hypothetical protein